MLTTLDHLVIAVRDLAAATDVYARLLGRRPSWRGSHPTYGTANTLFRLENVYVELLAPQRPGAVSGRLGAWLGDHGEGVQELIRVLLATDLAELEDRLHHKLVLGNQPDGTEFAIKPYGTNVLICGSSGAGKSTFATALLERLTDLKFQFLVIDPEGDYSTLESAIALGDHQRPPTVEEVLDVIRKVDQNSVVNLTGVGLKDRPKFFESVVARIQELRTKTGRPHWMFIDEAHHALDQVECESRALP